MSSAMKLLLYFFVLMLSFSFLGGCGSKEIDPEPITIKGYYKVDDLKVQSLLNMVRSGSGDEISWMDLKKGLEYNLRYLSSKPGQGIAAEYGKFRITWEMLRRTNAEFLELLPSLEESPELLEEKFDLYVLTPRTLLTGYYEPYLEASLTPDPEYPYPLYSVPGDLNKLDLGSFHHRWKGQTLLFRMEEGKVVPYYDREEIDYEGALAGRGLEIAWVKDIVDVFVLQIQGSGRLVLPDGSVKHVLYAGKNGLKYVSLGKELINRGLLPKEGMSMQKIRTFLSDNPDLVQELLITNPSYVFFRLDDEGPFGSMGYPLTPMVSVATDSKVLPLGSLALLSTRIPVEGDKNKRAVTGIVMAQDRGGAIKNTRVDLFCGSGAEAEFTAGHLRSWSHIYLLLSRSVMENNGE